MKKNKVVNDKQIKALERIRRELISLSLAPERYNDASSNVGMLFNVIIQSIDSILAYWKK